VVSLQQKTGNHHMKRDTEPVSWTYYNLYTKSMRIARCLSAKGVTPGSSIVVVLYNQIEWALMF